MGDRKQAPDRVIYSPTMEAFYDAKMVKAEPHDVSYIRETIADRATPQSGWQDIATAPKDGTLVMGGWHWGGWSYCIMRFNGDGWTKRFDANSCYNPTHWMPLPPMPGDANG